jgi:penicillin-binding protein 1A
MPLIRNPAEGVRMAETSGVPRKNKKNRAEGTRQDLGTERPVDAPAAPAEEAASFRFSRTGKAFGELSGALREELGAASRQAMRHAAIRTHRLRRNLRETDFSAAGAGLSGFAASVRRLPSGWRQSRNAGDATPLKPARRRSLVWPLLGAATLAGLAFVAAVLVWALRDVPWQEIADGTLEPVVVLETADGGQLVSQGPMRGPYVTLDQFPDHLIDAVIATEDRRFFEHNGIDLRGIARAALSNMRAGEVVQGGSTITQQLIKILYLESDRTFKRKIQEVVIAFWLESRLGKDEILARYLNNIYLGAGATGVPAAARIYFDKEVGELDLRESAMLAGLIRAPSLLNPIENPEGARERTSVVLQAMVESGALDAERASDARAEFADINPTKPATRSGSWFSDWVIEEAREIAGPFRGTITVRTTLVPRLQAIAERAVREGLESAGPSGPGQAALVAMTPDGAVVAMVGGRDYGGSEFNRAVTAMRQPGSTFKTFVYYAALKAGFDPRDRIEDEPVEIDGWTPENFAGNYRGRVSIAEAFARSLNAATVNLAMEVGLDNVVAAARELGIDAELAETPALALGASEVSLLDLTGAYASIRAGVAPVEPWGLVSFQADGQPRAFRLGPSEPPVTDISAVQREMVGLLQLVVERGTGQEAAFGGFAAGKTGTSQEHRDAWFVGFSEPLVVGVWVGNDDDEPMDDVTGGKLPAQIWSSFMEEALQGLDRGAPEEEEGSEAPVAAAADAPAPVACNVRACSRSYRSFRASDCTFQPYSGPRKLCEK